jgi:hypothetical protein
MIERISQAIIQQRLFVIIAALLIVVAAAAGLPNVKFSTDYRIFFSADNPHLQAFEDLQATFTKSDNVMFVIAPNDRNVFTSQTLAMVEELTEASWQLPYSIRADSITNYQHTIAEGDDLLVDNLVHDPSSLTETNLQEIKNVALQEPALAGRIIADTADVTGINVLIEIPGADPSKEVPEVASAARAMQAEFRDKYPNIDIRLTGQIIVDTAFKEAAVYDLTHIVPLAFVIAFACIAFYIYKASGYGISP